MLKTDMGASERLQYAEEGGAAWKPHRRRCFVRSETILALSALRAPGRLRIAARRLPICSATTSGSAACGKGKGGGL